MEIKINNKEYEVPQLGFKDMVKMEDMGFSIIDLFQNQKVFSVAAAYVAAEYRVAATDRHHGIRTSHLRLLL